MKKTLFASTGLGRALRVILPPSAFILGCALAFTVSAQQPVRTVRMIVPWSAGSGTDLMARAFAQELSKVTGQGIVVDNRGGAGATIGTEAAAKSPADGSVL